MLAPYNISLLRLVFLPISLSSYSSHNTKLIDLLIDLFKHHVCTELSDGNGTLYNYYKEMCGDVEYKSIYVYLSLREIYAGGSGGKLYTVACNFMLTTSCSMGLALNYK